MSSSGGLIGCKLTRERIKHKAAERIVSECLALYYKIQRKNVHGGHES